MRKILMSLIFAIAIASCFFAFIPVFAFDFNDPYSNQNKACSIDRTNPACQSGGNAFGTAKNLMNVALALIGVVCVFVIIYGGITISTSAGDSGKVKKGRDAILYGCIGLVIALAAAAIINFVLANVF